MCGSSAVLSIADIKGKEALVKRDRIPRAKEARVSKCVWIVKECKRG